MIITSKIIINNTLKFRGPEKSILEISLCHTNIISHNTMIEKEIMMIKLFLSCFAFVK